METISLFSVVLLFSVLCLLPEVRAEFWALFHAVDAFVTYS